jgi:hypothetical protein
MGADAPENLRADEKATGRKGKTVEDSIMVKQKTLADGTRLSLLTNVDAYLPDGTPIKGDHVTVVFPESRREPEGRDLHCFVRNDGGKLVVQPVVLVLRVHGGGSHGFYWAVTNSLYGEAETKEILGLRAQFEV